MLHYAPKCPSAIFLNWKKRMVASPYLEKVTAFITRAGPAGVELMLFQHPNAGIQIPAGTVEEGETLEQAVLREASEETGLSHVRIVRHIGWRDELPPGATHVILHPTAVYSRPDPTSSNWARFRRGTAVRLLRHAAGFAQITYEEGDRYPDPTYITYQITGWVPEDALAGANRRHFFHLACDEETSTRWSVFTDHHTFQPFWAPLANLPEIVAPQGEWLEFIKNDISER